MEWINIEKEKPNSKEMVLVWFNNHVSIALWNDGNFMWGDTRELVSFDADYWMRLPNKPR